MVLQIQGPAFRSPRQNPRQTTARAVGSEGSIVRFSKRRGFQSPYGQGRVCGAQPLWIAGSLAAAFSRQPCWRRTRTDLPRWPDPAGSHPPAKMGYAKDPNRQEASPRATAARLPAESGSKAARSPKGLRPLHHGDNRHPRLCCIWRFFWHLCGIPRTMQKTFLQDRLDVLGAGAGRLAGVRRNGSDVWVLSHLTDGAP